MRKYAYLICLVPALFGLAVVSLFGVNLLCWDEWTMPLLLNGLLENPFSLKELLRVLFAQHNEHRILFPKIIYFALSMINGMNSKHFMYLSWVFLCMTYGLVFLYIKNNTEVSHYTPPPPEIRAKTILFILGTGVLLFTTKQIENMLSGFQVAWFMIQFFAVLSFYFLEKAVLSRCNKYLFLTVIPAFIASFSSLQGLFILPSALCVMLLLVITKEQKKLTKQIAVIAVVMVLFSALYFYGYTNPMPYFGQSFEKTLGFFFVTLGNSLIPSGLFAGAGEPEIYFLPLSAGMTLAVSMVFLLIYLIKKRRLSLYIFPSGLIIFGLLFCASITMGRVKLGVLQSLNSRYTTFSLLITLGLILIVWKEFIEPAGFFLVKKIAVLALYSIFLLTILQDSRTTELLQLSRERRDSREVLLDYENRSLEELSAVFPWSDVNSARNAIKIVKERGWSAFN